MAFMLVLSPNRADRVFADDNPVTPVHDHEVMATRVPGARLEIIENCGRLSTIEQSEIVNRLLRNWLRETEAIPSRVKVRNAGTLLANAWLNDCKASNRDRRRSGRMRPIPDDQAVSEIFYKADASA
jgi:hypothetical protein